MTNLSEQLEEIEALKSIYDSSFKIETSNCYSMDINPNVRIFFTLNEAYPTSAPPTFELLAPTLNQHQKHQISNELQQIYLDNIGGPVLFQWIEKVKELVESNPNVSITTQTELVPTPVPLPKIDLTVIHGDIIQDRKSVFQGHVAEVKSLEETKAFINLLMENKKIAQATHNISAYRIINEKGAILQDCDDDGETHAGGRVLHLLQILDVKNVMVVVTRWYGGIHLGPDRFKHINNAARQVLVQANLVN